MNNFDEDSQVFDFSSENLVYESNWVGLFNFFSTWQRSDIYLLTPAESHSADIKLIAGCTLKEVNDYLKREELDGYYLYIDHIHAKKNSETK